MNKYQDKKSVWKIVSYIKCIAHEIANNQQLTLLSRTILALTPKNEWCCCFPMNACIYDVCTMKQIKITNEKNSTRLLDSSVNIFRGSTRLYIQPSWARETMLPWYSSTRPDQLSLYCAESQLGSSGECWLSLITCRVNWWILELAHHLYIGVMCTQ